MKPDFDIIIIGSGPAGVSAAFPLVKSGLRVLMVDGGKQASVLLPKESFLEARANDTEQWKWMVGEDLYALKMHDAISPKLRAPTVSYVFDQFERDNRIVGDNFITIGSLATGGLSNAWGGGVACFSKNDLSAHNFPVSEMEASYANVAMRIGISGGIADDLSDYFGLDEWAQPPIELDKLHAHLLNRYSFSKHKLTPLGFKIGRARVAVLTADRKERQACNHLGNCLWGCSRHSLYSSAYDMPALLKHENFTLQSGFLVEGISRKTSLWAIEGKLLSKGERKTISATKIFLAAGTLATSRIVLQTLRHYEEVPLLSCPTAAFMLWVPRLLGMQRASSATVGQLAFTLPLDRNITAFGATFGTTGIMMSEFLRRAPLRRPYGIQVFRNLLSSCIVGNLFLPGNLTKASVRLQTNSKLEVVGKYTNDVMPLMNEAELKLRKAYLKLGAILLPKSFTIGSPGGDIHYAGTHPMKDTPALGETSLFGEVLSLEGIHIVDGACLPILPAKSHTFMIMANADRIGHEIANRFVDSSL